jgi:hypothetical protein
MCTVACFGSTLGTGFVSLVTQPPSANEVAITVTSSLSVIAEVLAYQPAAFL